MSTSLNLTPGQTVEYQGRLFLITYLVDLDTILAKSLEDQSFTTVRLYIKDLRPPTSEAPNSAREEIMLVTDEDWREANRRFLMIQPFISNNRSLQAIQTAPNKTGVHRTTLYRWAKIYLQTGRISSLLPKKHNGGRVKSRLSREVENLINTTIKDYYLRSEKPSIQKTCDEVLRSCRAAGLESPHPNTVRNRIAQTTDQIKLERRPGRLKARDKYTPLVEPFPGTDFPFSIVQIDHIKIDFILVDEINRHPVGRPWITLAIDLFSRMILGFYISFDPPSAMSIGLCLAHTILPKESWLIKRDIATQWPCWGLMESISLDNAMQFHTEALKRVCLEHDIFIDWQPVAKPNYGVHIERLLDTFSTEIHSLTDTWLSNNTEPGNNDSVGRVAMTLSEFETWLATYITGVYHQRLHSALKTSPTKKYKKGIFGSSVNPGCGLPARMEDETRLKLDFMPFEECTIQKHGIVIDHVYYYSDVLDRFIHATNSNNRKYKQRFFFKRDPRDISIIYLYDEQLKEYHAIPYRDTSHPAISIWELKETIKRLRKQGHRKINESLIFGFYRCIASQEERAVLEIVNTSEKKPHHHLNRKIDNAHLTVSFDRSIGNELTINQHAITPFDELEEIE